MQAFSECFTLPEPSTSSVSGVRLEYPGGVLRLYFDYDRDGVIYNSGLLFKNVRAHIHTADSHCVAWKIEKSYDSLVKITGSKLVKELLESTVEDQRDSWVLNHYMIYFDSDGCYEIVAEDWKVLPENTGSLN